jgi:hypothetical protein
MGTETTYLVMWETQTKDGYSSRRYRREFTEDAKATATAFYLSKRRDQYPTLCRIKTTIVKPAYVDENGLYHASSDKIEVEILRQFGN